MKTIDKQPKNVLTGDKGRSRKRKKRRRRRVAVYARKSRLTDGQTDHGMEIQEGEPAEARPAPDHSTDPS